jgi:hypothetical protein
MMKRLSILAAALFATTALAGEYHTNATLKCSDCHTMHHSRAHSFGSTSVTAITDVYLQNNPSTTGNPALLLAADENLTCLVCHDGQSTIPDVFALDAGGAGTTRSAGGLNSGYAAIANVDGYVTNTGHSLGVNSGPPGFPLDNTAGWWGTFPTAVGALGSDGEFTCSDCHSVHGSGAYRNLGARAMSAKAKPGYAYIAAGGALNYVYDVNLVTGAARYSAAGIFYTDAHSASAATGPNKMNGLCNACHGQFHAEELTNPAGGTYFGRHPTDAVTITPGGLWVQAAVPLKLINVSTPNLVVNGNGNQDLSAQTGALVSPGCVTCHKGHGNKRDFGLLEPAGAPSTPSASGDGNLEDGSGTIGIQNLCWTCHGMGRTTAVIPQ